MGEKKTTSKSNMHKSYQKGVIHANELHKAHKELRMKIQSQVKTTAAVVRITLSFLFLYVYCYICLVHENTF